MTKIVAYINSHRKALIAAASAIVAIVVQVLGTNNHWVVTIVAIAAAVGVHVTPNKPAT